MHILHTAVGHILDVMDTLTVADLQQTVLKALVGEIELVSGVHDTHAIDHETIGIHVGRSWSEGSCPNTVGTLRHRFAAGKLDIHLYVFRMVIPITEGYSTVSIYDGRLL